MKTKRLFEAIKNDRGYVFIEASIVYPLMFFIIAFLIYSGNMFLLKARIHSEVSKEAIRYANYFSNPLIENIEDADYKVETKAGADLTNHLYRYFFKHGRYADKDEEADLQTRIGRLALFNSIKPEDIEIKKHDVRNYIIYQTYIVEVDYKLTFPIRMIFDPKPWTLDMCAREEAPVTDQSEFIRNVDMTIDYLEHSKKVNGMLEEYSRFMENAKEFISGDSKEGK